MKKKLYKYAHTSYTSLNYTKNSGEISRGFPVGITGDTAGDSMENLWKFPEEIPEQNFLKQFLK